MNLLQQHNEIIFLLHEEMAFGRGEEPYADELREQSEPFWNLMTKEEREKTNEFSAELYEIERLCHLHYKGK